MNNKKNVQKKKTLANTFSRVLFKTLVVVAVVLFGYIIFDRADFSSSSMTFKSGKNTSSGYTPSELKWYDSFRGIENVPDKNAKKSSGSNGNTGFRYEGFKK